MDNKNAPDWKPWLQGYIILSTVEIIYVYVFYFFKVIIWLLPS